MTVSRKALFVVFFAAAAAVCIASPFPENALGEESAIEQLPRIQEEVKKEEPVSGSSSSGFETVFFPSGSLYAPYLADPRRIGFGLQVLHYTKTGIPYSGNTRFDLKTGGEFGFVQRQPRGVDDLGWQFGLEAGFNSQFDINTHLDNIGWDGRYGFTLTTAQSRNLSMRFGYLHDSSHVGDEYAQRNGRLRIGYTREELAAGVSWLTNTGWRTYAEVAKAVHMGNGTLQKPGRVQLGFEWQAARAKPGGYRGWYGAADLSAMQERDWKLDVSLQAGYRLDVKSKTWRFGVDWYTGRPPIGEFFQYTETYLGFGLWVDI